MTISLDVSVGWVMVDGDRVDGTMVARSLSVSTARHSSLFSNETLFFLINDMRLRNLNACFRTFSG